MTKATKAASSLNKAASDLMEFATELKDKADQLHKANEHKDALSTLLKAMLVNKVAHDLLDTSEMLLKHDALQTVKRTVDEAEPTITTSNGDKFQVVTVYPNQKDN